MRKRSRKQREQEHHAWLRQQETLNAGCFKDRFPELKELTVEYQKYTDAGPHCPTSSGKWVFGPGSIALIRDRCDQRECVNGGFDLTNEIMQMLRSRELERKGKLICRGWQDEERIGQYHCHYVLEYKAKAIYHEPTSF